jgi:hypothetical protein
MLMVIPLGSSAPPEKDKVLLKASPTCSTTIERKSRMRSYSSVMDDGHCLGSTNLGQPERLRAVEHLNIDFRLARLIIHEILDHPVVGSSACPYGLFKF